jgi:5-formyltetrahydrofolate cyclo-ligase
VENQSGTSTKTQLRRSLLAQRQALSPLLWQQKSQALCSHLQNSQLFNSAKTVLAYLSHRQEPDLQPLFRNSATQWGLPRCQGKQLIWHCCSPLDPRSLLPGAYGIWEPRPDLPELTAAEVDLILVPAVGCDLRGYRLGYGGGFYDRLLSQPEWRSVPAIGIVFAAAYLDKLPIDSWDQTLKAICTETGFFQSADP